MDELRTALIVLGAVFIAGLALWERRRARRRARTMPMPEPAPTMLPAVSARRMEPSIGDFSVPGPTVKLDTLEVPVIHTTEPVRVDVMKESAVDVPAAARHETPRAVPSAPVVPVVPAAPLAPPVAPGTEAAILWPPAHTERVLSLRLVRAGGEPLSGRALRQALEAAGMRHGPQRIYHLVDSGGHVLASAANLVRPGSLNPDEMDTQELRGLSVFSILPGPQPAPQMLEVLMKLARGIAARTEAVVQDEQGALVDSERLTQLRRSVQGYADTVGDSTP